MDDCIMQCNICHRSPSTWLPFNCTRCARNAIYEPRIQLVETLIQHETNTAELEGKVGVQISKSTKDEPGTKVQRQTAHPAWILEQVRAEQAAAKERTQDILSHVEALRKETEGMKAAIAERRSVLSRHQANLQTARNALADQRSLAFDPLDKGIRRMESRWDAMHTKTAESRVFLCHEAARLYGLRKRKKAGAGRDVYSIGNVSIFDLRDLNGASPVQVTASSTNLAHLVYLVAHYLSLRLPAEIRLPHRDHPLPTIFPPGSSYTAREVTDLGSAPFHSSSNSPSSSRTGDQSPRPRPRPLHLDRKLPALAKEDPVTYALFVEGITLLAWDIAWVCKSQGLDVSLGSWEEVCALGQNLWQLLIAAPPSWHRSSPSPGPLSKPVPARDSPSRPALSTNAPTTTHSTPSEPARAPPPVQLGHFSHGTGHSFLGAAEGAEYMHQWRLHSSAKVIEKVKAMLLSERTGAEWEILDGTEWKEEGKDGDGKEADDHREMDIAEEAVVVKGKGKAKGTSGWMKLKSRGGI